jgi:hypothetical protein
MLRLVGGPEPTGQVRILSASREPVSIIETFLAAWFVCVCGHFGTRCGRYDHWQVTKLSICSVETQYPRSSISTALS